MKRSPRIDLIATLIDLDTGAIRTEALELVTLRIPVDALLNMADHRTHQ